MEVEVLGHLSSPPTFFFFVLAIKSSNRPASGRAACTYVGTTTEDNQPLLCRSPSPLLLFHHSSHSLSPHCITRHPPST